jgi:cation transport regulator ChaC
VVTGASEEWIFGYGSLLWRPAFPFTERRPAMLTGWVRRFWQGSPDHRGRPELPGRVVTLHRAAGAACWGMLYRLPRTDAPAILAGLDVREQGGYHRRQGLFRLRNGSGQRALFYFAGVDNPNYLGPAPVRRIAARILAAEGPSGSNVDYLLRLQHALAGIGVSDPHVAALQRLVLLALEKRPAAPIA